MEMKRVFRAIKYKPKYRVKEEQPLFRRHGFPIFVGFIIVGMALGGLWLTKVVERNINDAIIGQIGLVQSRPRPVETTEPSEQPEQPEPKIVFRPEYMVRPVEFEEIVRRIGWIKHPRFGYWLYHDGVDLMVSSGNVIRAVAPGVVTEIIRNYDEEGLGVAGTRITLSHDQRGNSVYIFSGEVEVNLGESVIAGSALGTVHAGREAASPVHIGISWDGQGLDWLAMLENRG